MNLIAKTNQNTKQYITYIIYLISKNKERDAQNLTTKITYNQTISEHENDLQLDLQLHLKITYKQKYIFVFEQKN